MSNAYPDWICRDCGTKYGRRQPSYATWHDDTCDICGAQGVPCTEPRDYGHLPAWERKIRK